MRRLSPQGTDGRFATFIDESGHPPHDGNDCDVCRLFGPQQPGESRSEWLARITGYTSTRLEEAS